MEISNEKVDRYLEITKKALAKVKIVNEGKVKDWKSTAEDFLDMAQRYYSDAGYFKKKGDLINAFAATNYAHGWLDAGARIGLFDVGNDNILFTVDGDFSEKDIENYKKTEASTGVSKWVLQIAQLLQTL